MVLLQFSSVGDNSVAHSSIDEANNQSSCSAFCLSSKAVYCIKVLLFDMSQLQFVVEQFQNCILTL